MLLLAQEGRLSVKDKVARYYPILTRAHDISLLDLIDHVSGYADYYPLDFVDRRMEAPIAADDLIAQYAGGKLDFEPGSKWSYSNTGYVILGRVVEKASGEPLGAFMTRRILRPLGMAHRSLDRRWQDRIMPKATPGSRLGRWCPRGPKPEAGWRARPV